MSDKFGVWDESEDSMAKYYEEQGLIDSVGAPELPEPTRTTWVTREGERIPVKQMTDSHLVNTIRYLRRNGVVTKSACENAGYSMLGMLQGEMAIDSVERDLGRLESQTVDEYLGETCPTFDSLLIEAEKRGLKP